MTIENTAIAYCASCGDEMEMDDYVASRHSCCASCESIQMEAKEILQIRPRIIALPVRNVPLVAESRRRQSA